MKKLIFILLAASGMLAGCGSGELSKDEALKLINHDEKRPRIVSRAIFCSDPGHAKMVLLSGLEEKGYVKVQRRYRTLQEGKVDLVTFTEKAKPYLLPVPENDRKDHIRMIKMADEEITDIAIVKTGNRETAIAEYTTVCKNLTPFAVLATENLSRPKKHRANFAQSDKGWILQTYP